MLERASGVLLVVHARTRLPRLDRPLRDFDVMRDVLHADVLDTDDVDTNAIASVAARVLGPHAALGWLALMRGGGYSNVYCDSEGYGLALALLMRLLGWRTRLTLMVHNINGPLKRLLLFAAHRHVDAFLVNGSSLQRTMQEAHSIPAEKIHLVPMFVDTDFWKPSGRTTEKEAYICSAGLQLRDYDTLADAARTLPVSVRIAAASAYARPESVSRQTPANVQYVDCDTRALRSLYDDAILVVVPLFENNSVAGVTTMAEAMAMGKCVVASRTTGQGDAVSDRRATVRVDRNGAAHAPSCRREARPTQDAGATGFYVPPGDASELSRTLKYLIAHRNERDAIGASGRRFAEQVLDVRRVGAQMAKVICPTVTLDEAEAGGSRSTRLPTSTVWADAPSPTRR